MISAKSMVLRAPCIGRMSRRAFTLTELLVVIAVIMVIALLAFMGTSKMIRDANAAKDTTTMRQIGTNIFLYAADNNDSLPGPLFQGQNLDLRINTPTTRSGTGLRLVDYLCPYYGYDEPKVELVIEPMACAWQKSPAQKLMRTYELQPWLRLDSGINDRPWGVPPKAAPADRIPMKMAAVQAQRATARTWMMWQADPPAAPGASPPGLRSGLAHGSFRLAMAFDCSISKVDRSNARQ